MRPRRARRWKKSGNPRVCGRRLSVAARDNAPHPKGCSAGHRVLNAIDGSIAMKLPQTGGCQCGKIRYEITAAPQLVYTCHCTDCQRLTSSAFSMGIVLAETAFRLGGIE